MTVVCRQQAARTESGSRLPQSKEASPPRGNKETKLLSQDTIGKGVLLEQAMKTILPQAILAFVLLLMGRSNADEPGRPRLQIINGSDAPIGIFWLKTPDERVPNGRVAPGKEQMIITTLGHRFAIVGQNGVERIVTDRVPLQAFRFDVANADGVPRSTRNL
jgi:hypothetical protein